MNPSIRLLTSHEAHTPADPDDFGSALRAGLRETPRRISPKFFYDAAGATLFEQICELPEYYPTRTELDLLARYADAMAALIGPCADVIEFGAGAMSKIRVLLRALESPVRYVPVDISTEHLHHHAQALAAEFPHLEVMPLAADFTGRIALPAAKIHPRSRVGFFPGSSIGNFTPDDACRFLRAAARTLRGGGLLIGVDLVKDPQVLHAAYNDRAGVTSAFNKNLLARANRELNANFNLDAFDHYAWFNPHESRIEMHLISAADQRVTLGDETVEFAHGQTLHTENSYKYTVASFQALARQGGFEPRQVWCDERQWFSVHWLAAPA